jgi:hypothetical protein
LPLTFPSIYTLSFENSITFIAWLLFCWAVGRVIFRSYFINIVLNPLLCFWKRKHKEAAQVNYQLHKNQKLLVSGATVDLTDEERTSLERDKEKLKRVFFYHSLINYVVGCAFCHMFYIAFITFLIVNHTFIGAIETALVFAALTALIKDNVFDIYISSDNPTPMRPISDNLSGFGNFDKPCKNCGKTK